MAYRVLDIGQCDADNYRISELLTNNFDVEVMRAHSHEEAIRIVAQSEFNLILINRVFDRDGSEGMRTLQTLKSAENTATIPTMLVSNFPDSQQAAVAAGAVPGFGKRALNDPATVELIGRYLGN